MFLPLDYFDYGLIYHNNSILRSLNFISTSTTNSSHSSLSSFYSSFNPFLYSLKNHLRLSHSRIVANKIDSLYSKFSLDKHNLDFPDIPWGEIWNGKRRAFNFLKDSQSIMNYYFKLCQIAQPRCLQYICSVSCQKAIPFLRSITDYIKLHFNDLPPIAYMYCEIQQLMGFPDSKNRTQDDDPVQWLSVDSADTHSKEWYEQNIIELFSKGNINQPFLSYNDFVLRRHTWVSPGSSNTSKLLLDGDRIKTKFGAAVSLPDNELLDIAHARPGLDLPIFIKPDEKGIKKRLIASVNLSGYIKAAYIRYLIEQLHINNKFMKDSLDLDDDYEVISLLRDGRVAIPIDESKFDYHVSRAAFLGFNSALKRIFPDNEGVSIFLDWFMSPPKWGYENMTGPWLKGMPSGLALTSILNSIFNYCKQKDLESPIHYALGDDVLIFNDNYSLQQIADHYATFGAEVNPHKNFRSNQYAEYLHFLFTRFGKTGYPARIFGSLIWGQSLPKVDPSSKLFETALLFKEFYDRALLPLEEHIICSDLSRAVSNTLNGFSRSEAQKWLHIPRALGGFGLTPEMDLSFSVKSTTSLKKYYQDNIIKLPPVIVKKVNSYQFSKFKRHNSKFRFGPVFSLPPLDSVERWEQRLNMEEQEVTSLQYEYGLATIPLPCVPFVSESRMSMLSNYYGFNAYPNVSGSASARISRFLDGAKKLKDVVFDMMSSKRIFFYL